MGWERANYFAPPGTPPAISSFAAPDWLPQMLREQQAAREAAVIFDQSSFSKFLLQGKDALAVLQWICANQMDVDIGRIVYTAMLNERGGFESDVTVMRLAPQRFMMISGTAQTTRDMAWVERQIEDRAAVLTDVTSAYGVLSVMGPQAEAILARLSPEVARKDVKAGDAVMIDLGLARVLAAAVSYIGGPGYELYVPTDLMVTVYEALWDAGRGLGLLDAGYYTIDALRIEAGRRAFGTELGPDETPQEAGLAYAVKLDKTEDFVGRTALRQQQAKGVYKRLAMFSLDRPGITPSDISPSHIFPWGGEIILRDGLAVGEISSAGYSRLKGSAIVMGYVRSDQPLDKSALADGRYELDLAGERYAMTYLAHPPYRLR